MIDESVRLPTTEVAKILRRKLRENFPRTKFSVRCGRGTASAWIDVFWTDGPDEQAVREICDPWRGAHFDGMQDMLVQHKPMLVALEPGQLPVTVKPVVDGILYHRRKWEV